MSTNRDRDANRKYESGGQKRKKAEKKKVLANLQKGRLLKYFNSHDSTPGSSHTEPASDHENLSDKDDKANCSEIPVNVSFSDDTYTTCTTKLVQDNIILDDGESLDKDIRTDSALTWDVTTYNELGDDPGKWPSCVTSNIRVMLLNKVPVQVKNYEFPADESGRRFNTSYYTKNLLNGEQLNRSWLLYSKCKDRVYCFYCYLFGHNLKSALANDGLCDWKHLSTRLSEHESSQNHKQFHSKFIELKKLLNKEETIDAVQQRLINADIEHWREVLKRIILCIQFLAKNNDAFRGTNNTIFTENNGKFLGLIEMISKFDTRMAEHLRRIKDKETNDHYLGQQIQNEIIQLMGNKIKNEIVKKIKNSKYFSIQMDCTRDRSHLEQLTFIIRIVELIEEDQPEIKINEYFIGFTPMTKCTGFDLSEELNKLLQDLDLDINNCRGQSYDNGANMIGKRKGVQARILAKNPTAFFVSCTAHSLNLLLGDMATSVPTAMVFFGTVQRLYTLFSGSAQRWQILKEHLPELTLKPLSETRWECRLNAIKPLRFNLDKILNALEALKYDTEDPAIRSETNSLIDTEINYEFALSIIIWHDLLLAVDKISKIVQKIETDISETTTLLKGLVDYLKKFRENGFEKSKLIANKICEKSNIAIKFKTLRSRKRKRFFDYEDTDSCTSDSETNFYRNYFLNVVDQGIMSTKERFQQIKEHEETFGFLYDIPNLKTMDENCLRKHCMDLALKNGVNRDINGSDLYEELKIFSIVCCNNMSSMAPKECLNKLSSMQESFPNLFTALRILLTIPIASASAERSFSKLKLIKNYLRSSMAQDRLVSLALISIENELCNKLDLDSIINDFAEIKARKVILTK